MKKTPTAPRAEYATKPLTPVMAEYAAWLKVETGYDVDPMSVMLSSSLRGAFQKSPKNQERIAQAAEKVKVEAAARAARKVERKALRDNIDADPSLDDPKPATKRRRRPAAQVIAIDTPAPESAVPA